MEFRVRGLGIGVTGFRFRDHLENVHEVEELPVRVSTAKPKGYGLKHIEDVFLKDSSSKGQNPALTVLFVLDSLGSGHCHTSSECRVEALESRS